MSAAKLTAAQETALRLAVAHGWVFIGKGYGRDMLHPNAIAAATWKRLVLDGYLTPHSNGAPWAGVALRVEGGRSAWLTPKGREAFVKLGGSS